MRKGRMRPSRQESFDDLSRWCITGAVRSGRKRQIEKADTTHRIGQEESRRALVDLEAANARTSADARAYALEAVVKALAGTDPKLVQVLAQARMKPDALVAAAMTEFAANAEKIGEINLSPELLHELLKGK